MRKQLSCLSTSGFVSIAVALLVVVILGLARGGVIFSPGPLNAQAGPEALGGVSTHAETGGHCSACHVAPWSQETMSVRCLGCHTNVAQEIQDPTSLHGTIDAGGKGAPCYNCHPEHRGAAASLTVLNGTGFDHSRTAFPLTGAHLAVACTRCHANNVFVGTPQDCLSCHGEPDYHAGLLGTDCAGCHNTAGWTPARFAATHSFPLNHGFAQGSCRTCHPSYLGTYTCYGCHEHKQATIEQRHQEEGIANLHDCARCHPQGRGGDQ